MVGVGVWRVATTGVPSNGDSALGFGYRHIDTTRPTATRRTFKNSAPRAASRARRCITPSPSRSQGRRRGGTRRPARPRVDHVDLTSSAGARAARPGRRRASTRPASWPRPVDPSPTGPVSAGFGGSIAPRRPAGTSTRCQFSPAYRQGASLSLPAASGRATRPTARLRTATPPRPTTPSRRSRDAQAHARPGAAALVYQPGASGRPEFDPPRAHHREHQLFWTPGSGTRRSPARRARPRSAAPIRR